MSRSRPRICPRTIFTSEDFSYQSKWQRRATANNTGATLVSNECHRHSLLTSVAPVLFAVALLCHFDWYEKSSEVKIVRGQIRGLDLDMKRHFTKTRPEKALKHILTGKDRRLI